MQDAEILPKPQTLPNPSAQMVRILSLGDLCVNTVKDFLLAYMWATDLPIKTFKSWHWSSSSELKRESGVPFLTCKPKLSFAPTQYICLELHGKNKLEGVLKKR